MKCWLLEPFAALVTRSAPFETPAAPSEMTLPESWFMSEKNAPFQTAFQELLASASVLELPC